MEDPVKVGVSSAKKSSQKYMRTKLGYREQRRSICPHLSTELRISLVYDFKVRNMTIKEMVPKY